MSEPTLAWTITPLANQFTFLRDKIYFKFGENDTVYDAWKVWAAASGSTEEKAAAIKFSGKTIDFTISNGWIDAWPAPDVAKKQYEYVTKWSGGCIRDYSSKMGGFCLLEDNETAFWDCGEYVDCLYAAPLSSEAVACPATKSLTCPDVASAYIAGTDEQKTCDLAAYNLAAVLLDTKLNICGPGSTTNASTAGTPCEALTSIIPGNAQYPIIEENRGGPINVYWNRNVPDPSVESSAKDASDGTVYNQGTRSMMFYRLAAADFTAFEGAWKNTALTCDKKTTNAPAAATELIDGRAYQLSIRDKRVNTDSDAANLNLEYFDYPKCALGSGDEADDWQCQMYLPLRDKQTEGYPSLDQPGVITGYYVSSYFPGVDIISYSKSTQLYGASSGDMALTAASALALTVTALLF